MEFFIRLAKSEGGAPAVMGASATPDARAWSERISANTC
jgi:hypothetical protein